MFDNKKYTFNSAQGAIFWQLVCLIFIVAKVFNYITWSWWLVFAPIWGPLALVLGILVLILVVCFIVYLACWILDKIIS